jgi:hypothetical protein
MSTMVTSLERRLAKIEAARRSPRGLFFVVWGCIPAEIEEAVSQARRSGHIVDGEPVVRCAWPAEYPVPAARWVRDDRNELSQIEFGALMGEVDRYSDDLRAALRVEAERRGEPELTRAEIEAVDWQPNDKARTMSDAALIGIVLSAPLNGERTSLTEDRMWRVVHSIETLGFRDRIRGRDDALFEAIECAGRVVRH